MCLWKTANHIRTKCLSDLIFPSPGMDTDPHPNSNTRRYPPLYGYLSHLHKHDR